MDKILWDLKGSCFFTSWWCHEIVSVLFVLSNSWLACLQTKALAVAELLCWFDRVRRSLRKKAHVSMSSGGDWLPCSLLTALCRQSVVFSSGFCDRMWKEWTKDLLKRPLHMWAVSKSSGYLTLCQGLVQRFAKVLSFGVCVCGQSCCTWILHDASKQKILKQSNCVNINHLPFKSASLGQAGSVEY